MPNYSPNFNLPLALGTDLYNHLTIDNAAYNIIDNQMFKNQNAAFSIAEHTKSGNQHTLTESITTCPVFRFTATADFASGDSFVVNGSVVSARLPNGASIPNRGFVINSNVIALLNGGVLTLFLPGEPSKQSIVDIVYPVGSIYFSGNSVSPAVLFGGSWVQIKGAFLIGEDGQTLKLGSTGGSSTHTHDLPMGFDHSANYGWVDGDGNPVYGSTVHDGIGRTVVNTSLGSGVARMAKAKPTEVLPPYLAVAIWQRTA